MQNGIHGQKKERKKILLYISVFERLQKDEENKWRVVMDVHVSVLDGSEIQDSMTTFAILKRSLEIYSKAYPSVKRAILKSDNAGRS